MFTTILLAILMASASVDETSVAPEPLNISIGGLSVTGNAIKLVRAENGDFECAVDGNSQVSIGSDGDIDITIAARNIVIVHDVNAGFAIRCSGDCRFSDSEYSCSAESMQMRFKGGASQLQLTGDCRVAYGSGDGQTVLAAESITFEDSTIRASGAVSLERPR
jgi:hypothetical protein